MSNHILHMAYYDPFDAAEEAYVARRWCEVLGKPEEQIAVFYAGMREWRMGDQSSPHYDAADSRHYPDMVQAGVRAGLTGYGAAVIRNLMREYRAEVQP